MLSETGWPHGTDDDVDSMIAVRRALYGQGLGSGGRASSGLVGGHDRMISLRRSFDDAVGKELTGGQGDDDGNSRLFQHQSDGEMDRIEGSKVHYFEDGLERPWGTGESSRSRAG